MILAELLGRSLDKLVSRKDTCTDRNYRCAIDDHFSSSHQASFVIVGAKTLPPCDSAHVAKLSTAQTSAESVESHCSKVSDSSYVVASNAQFYQSLAMLIRLISFC